MYYVGQTVAIRGAGTPAIVLQNSTETKNRVWLYFLVTVEEKEKISIDFDEGYEDSSDLSPITEDTKETVTGTKIHYGEFCTKKLAGELKINLETTKQFESYLKKIMKWRCFNNSDEKEEYHKKSSTKNEKNEKK